MSKSHSVEAFQKNPSVRKVISQLEANFSRIKLQKLNQVNSQQQHLPYKTSVKVNDARSVDAVTSGDSLLPPPPPPPIDRRSSVFITSSGVTCRSDAPTQTECEIVESTVETNKRVNRSTTNLMDSDSSVLREKSHSEPQVLTTVSVSTCPSCGTENISSEGTKRSSSFQHLLHNSPRVIKATKHSCHNDANKVTQASKFDKSMPPRSQSFQVISRNQASCMMRGPICSCQCNCIECVQRSRKGVIRAKRVKRKRHTSHRLMKNSAGDSRYLSIYPPGVPVSKTYWLPETRKEPVDCSICFKNSCQPISTINDVYNSNGFSNGIISSPNRNIFSTSSVKPVLRNYRYWDIDEWRAQIKREKAKNKERRALAMVCALSILIFISISYFGTILFLRVTKLSWSRPRERERGKLLVSQTQSSAVTTWSTVSSCESTSINGTICTLYANAMIYGGDWCNFLICCM